MFTLDGIRTDVLQSYWASDGPLLDHVMGYLYDCPEERAGELFKELMRVHPGVAKAPGVAGVKAVFNCLVYGVVAWILATDADVRRVNHVRVNRHRR